MPERPLRGKLDDGFGSAAVRRPGRPTGSLLCASSHPGTDALISNFNVRSDRQAVALVSQGIDRDRPVAAGRRVGKWTFNVELAGLRRRMP